MRNNTTISKVCKRCGEKFIGGNTAKYCYTCKDKIRDEYFLKK